MARKYFEETQKFGSLGLYLGMTAIYGTVLSIFGIAFYRQFVQTIPFGDHPISDEGLLLTSALIMVILGVSGWLLLGSRFQVEIRDTGISLRFWPYMTKTRIIAPGQISSYEIRTYKPIREYGGWGLRKGVKKTGDAYNVHGNIGLQLVLNGGKRILIGTQRPEAMLHAMNKMMELK
ncbi:MAG: hypothetical protein WC341_01920 [Bacteroidales bacterium]|jgi:hypothetical protein